MGAGQGSKVNKSFVSPTQRKREAPRTHSLTPSLSVCLHLSLYSPTFGLFCLTTFPYIFLSGLKRFSICPPYTQRRQDHFSVHLLNTLFTILVYSAECLGRGGGGLSKHLQLKQHKQHLKAFTAPALSSLSFCGFIGSKEGCSCVIVRKSFITTATHTHTNVCTHAYTQRHDDSSA